jgi:hypothetical protein
MNESNQTTQSGTEHKTTRGCQDIPPIYAESLPLKGQTYPREERRSKFLTWGGQVYHAGDCRISNMDIEFFSDGLVRFRASIYSSSSDNCWVFYGGISIFDNHSVELWKSGKLVSQTIGTGSEEPWVVLFHYPALWFDSIVSARCNQMHC